LPALFAQPGRLERRPEGTPALLDDSLGLAEQHVGLVAQLPALLDEETRSFAQRLCPLSNFGGQHRAAIEMCAYDVGQVSPALWAQVRATAEQVGRELAQLKASSTRQKHRATA